MFSCHRTDSFNRSKPRRIDYNKMTGGEGVGFVSLSPSKEVWSRVTQELPCFDRISIRICTGNLFNRIAICRADNPCTTAIERSRVSEDGFRRLNLQSLLLMMMIVSALLLLSPEGYNRVLAPNSTGMMI